MSSVQSATTRPHGLASTPPRADCHRGRVRRHHANRAPLPLHERFDIANAPPSRAPQRGRAACEPAQTSRNVGHAHHVTVTCMNHRLRVAAVPAVRLNDLAGDSTRSSTRTSTASALVRCRRVWSVRRALVRVHTRRAECRRRRRQQRHDRRSQRPRRRAGWGSRAPVTTNTSVGAGSRRTHCGTVTSSPASRSNSTATRSPHRATAALTTLPAQPRRGYANQRFEQSSRSAQTCPLRPQRNQLSLPAVTLVAEARRRRRPEPHDSDVRVSCRRGSRPRGQVAVTAVSLWISLGVSAAV